MLNDKLTLHHIKGLHNDLYIQLSKKVCNYELPNTSLMDTSSYRLIVTQLDNLLEIQITSDLNITKLN